MEIMNNISYGLQLFFAEMIFLYSFPKRQYFGLRILTAFALVLGINYFNLGFLRFWSSSAIMNFAGLLLTLGVSFFGMWFAFDSAALSVLSGCVAGVAVQHISHHIYRLVSLIPFRNAPQGLIIEFATAAVVDLLVWITVGQWVAQRRIYEDNDRRMISVTILIVLICIGITRLLRLAGPGNTYMTLCTSLYAIICCTLALYVEFYVHESVRVQSEMLVLKRINDEERRRYELSRENAEQMNIKYHDLKHKLRYLEQRLPQEELDAMRTLIDSYERTYDTGLDVLDIVLNEKQMHCREKGITLTVMGNGTALSFMNTMDVYSLFGNLMDNAIEAVEILEPEKRQISLVLEQRGEFVYISCMNYTGSKVTLRQDGLPGTTKTQELGYHGYGLRSIRMIAEKYRGDISIQAENGMFAQSIYMTGDGDRTGHECAEKKNTDA